MFVYIYIYPHIYVSIYIYIQSIYIYIHIDISIHPSIHLSIYLSVCLSVYLYTYIHVCIYNIYSMCMYVYIYVIYTYIWFYGYTYIYIYLHDTSINLKRFSSPTCPAATKDEINGPPGRAGVPSEAHHGIGLAHLWKKGSNGFIISYISYYHPFSFENLYSNNLMVLVTNQWLSPWELYGEMISRWLSDWEIL